MKHPILVAIAAALAVSLSVSTMLNAEEAYMPIVDPADFSATIDNPYFRMPVGKTMYFESKTKDGLETTRIEITGDKLIVMGVETLVYWDRVYLNGRIKEETHDYLAQHSNGDVWYFGEDVDNYEDGKLKNHNGSWLAGRDGALPGIWLKANPRVGEVYREEYYQGHAEDMAKVMSVSETLTTSLGSFMNCIKTENWTPLEPDVKEAKHYCADAGGPVQEDNITEDETDTLIKVENGG